MMTPPWMNWRCQPVLKRCVGWAGKHRYVLLANGFVLLFFTWLTLYVKLAVLRNTPDQEAHYQVLVGLFEDPFSRTRPYAGLLTSVSEMLWCAIASLCILTTLALLWLRFRQRQRVRFLQWASLLACALLFDDVFRLTLLLKAVLGVPKVLMYGLYGAGAIAMIVKFGGYILRQTPYRLLIAVSVLFLISGAVDTFPPEGRGSLILLEDGTKLLGLVNLTAYFGQLCRANLTAAVGDYAERSRPVR